MSLFTIYTYENIEELQKIQRENEITTFVFGETKETLKKQSDIYIDISSLVYYLKVNKHDIYAAYINLREITEKTKIIIEESIVGDALSLFPFLFIIKKPFFEPVNQLDSEKNIRKKKYCRQLIYIYNNVEDLNIIIDYADEKDIPIITFSRASRDMQAELEKINESLELVLLDLTSVSYAIEDNKNLIYQVEVFLNKYSNIKIIALSSEIDKIIKYFPLYIKNQESIKTLLPDLKENINIIDNQRNKTTKITDLSDEQLDKFTQYFNHNLIGHKNFKKRLKGSLKKFVKLNKFKQQSVFSMLLFGQSGIGKTEVARLIANGLQQSNYLVKINFQNYSSQDALNILIGSPPGYVGCEDGELGSKIKKSNVGIILCDEFEKTTKPVFSFFLELLEEGKFTDSMAREYDVDGYIIVFTTNLLSKSQYEKVMPPELQTRFDLICEFQEPTYEDKTKFLDLLLEKAKDVYSEEFLRIQMTPHEKQELYNFDYYNIRALRDIKRLFNNRLIDFLSRKECED